MQTFELTPSDADAPAIWVDEDHGYVPRTDYDRAGAVMPAKGLGERHRDHRTALADYHKAGRGVRELRPDALGPGFVGR
jgi:hypothetical protein